PPGCNHYIPILNRSVVALNQQGAGFSFMAIQCSAGYSRYFLVADDHFAVSDNRYHSAHECNIVALPFAGRLGGHERWLDESIDGAKVVLLRFFAIAVFNLHFIATAEVNTAIAAWRTTKFNMKFKIGKFLVANQVGA